MMVSLRHDDFEEREIHERETLDRISPKAVPVALNAGELRGQDLRADAPSGTGPTPVLQLSAARRPGSRDIDGADILHDQLVHRPRHFERRRGA